MSDIEQLASDLIAQHTEIERRLLAAGFRHPERLHDAAYEAGLTGDMLSTREHCAAFCALIQCSCDGIEPSIERVAIVLVDQGVKVNRPELETWLTAESDPDGIEEDAKLVARFARTRCEAAEAIAELRRKLEVASCLD